MQQNPGFVYFPNVGQQNRYGGSFYNDANTGRLIKNKIIQLNKDHGVYKCIKAFSFIPCLSNGMPRIYKGVIGLILFFIFCIIATAVVALTPIWIQLANSNSIKNDPKNEFSIDVKNGLSLQSQPLVSILTAVESNRTVDQNATLSSEINNVSNQLNDKVKLKLDSNIDKIFNVRFIPNQQRSINVSFTVKTKPLTRSELNTFRDKLPNLIKTSNAFDDLKLTNATVSVNPKADEIVLSDAVEGEIPSNSPLLLQAAAKTLSLESGKSEQLASLGLSNDLETSLEEQLKRPPGPPGRPGGPNRNHHEDVHNHRGKSPKELEDELIAYSSNINKLDGYYDYFNKYPNSPDVNSYEQQNYQPPPYYNSEQPNNYESPQEYAVNYQPPPEYASNGQQKQYEGESYPDQYQNQNGNQAEYQNYENGEYNNRPMEHYNQIGQSQVNFPNNRPAQIGQGLAINSGTNIAATQFNPTPSIQISSGIMSENNKGSILSGSGSNLGVSVSGLSTETGLINSASSSSISSSSGFQSSSNNIMLPLAGSSNVVLPSSGLSNVMAPSTGSSNVIVPSAGSGSIASQMSSSSNSGANMNTGLSAISQISPSGSNMNMNIAPISNMETSTTPSVSINLGAAVGQVTSATTTNSAIIASQSASLTSGNSELGVQSRQNSNYNSYGTKVSRQGASSNLLVNGSQNSNMANSISSQSSSASQTSQTSQAASSSSTFS